MFVILFQVLDDTSDNDSGRGIHVVVLNQATVSPSNRDFMAGTPTVSTWKQEHSQGYSRPLW